MDAVSEILADRTRETDSLARTVVVSFAIHVVLVAAFAYMPRMWDPAPDPGHVMVITIGGAPGPVQGRNPIAAKPVQQAVPETAKPRNDAPPAAAKPEMIEPVKTAPPPPKA